PTLWPLGDCPGGGTACAWDAAYKLEHQPAGRKLFTPIYSSGAWTLTEINSANANTIATAAGVATASSSDFVALIRQTSPYARGSGPMLGSIDTSTPAVIQEANSLVA